jgi:hypothetical protein
LAAVSIKSKNEVRDYLAAIGKRGLASRRELTRSHAKQMVAIRKAQTRRAQSGEVLASSRPQTAKTYMTELIYRKPLTMHKSCSSSVFRRGNRWKVLSILALLHFCSFPF